MKPCIDGDILLHEIGWSGQIKQEDGSELILDFDWIQTLLHQKIKFIVEDSGADEPPVLFLSDHERIAKIENRQFTPNFRYKIAKTKPYKGNRKNPKPFHFWNIFEEIRWSYETIIAEDGLEADDEMGIYQSSAYRAGFRESTIICSRDKDLRMIPGWHYSWECGKQASIGPHYTGPEGSIEKTKDGKVLAYGLKLLCYQLLAGDSADNIPGLPKYGQEKAFKIIAEDNEDVSLITRVELEYEKVLGDDWFKYFIEQYDLLKIKETRKT